MGTSVLQPQEWDFAKNLSLEADSTLEPSGKSPADQYLDFSQDNEQGTQPHHPRLLTYRMVRK